MVRFFKGLKDILFIFPPIPEEEEVGVSSWARLVRGHLENKGRRGLGQFSSSSETKMSSLGIFGRLKELNMS